MHGWVGITMYNYFMLIGRVAKIEDNSCVKDNFTVLLQTQNPSKIFDGKGKPVFEHFEVAVPNLFKEYLKENEIVAIKGRIGKTSQYGVGIYLQAETVRFPERMTKNEE